MQLPIIPARYYLRLLDLLVQRGIAVEEVFQAANIDFKQYMQDSDSLLTLDQVQQFVGFCLKFPQSMDAAFELGRSLKLSSHHLVGYALLTCDTFEQAMHLVSRYFSLIVPMFRVTVVARAEEMELQFAPVMPMDMLTLNFHLEAIAVALHCNIMELLNGELERYHMFLSIHEPLHIRKYAVFSGVQYHFNALLTPGVKVVFGRHMLRKKLPMADAYTLSTIEQRCQEQMHKIRNRGEISGWIKMMLSESYQVPTLAECASLLNISAKTLQRYIQKENSSFHSLRKEVLLQRSMTLLGQHTHTASSIAHELGYSSPANFIRAFKAETGLTPIQYRQQNLERILAAGTGEDTQEA